MAMKKKFLGLAMAAMIALPASSVYANSYTTIQGDDTKVYNQNVAVTGSVSRANGTAAAGKIEVELPTAMTFAVDKDSRFTGATYNVDNKSGCGIDVSVEQFTTTRQGITVKKESEINENVDRSNVSLALQGSVGGQATKVDLASVADGTVQNKKVLNVGAGSQGAITLSGTAGTKEVKNNDTQEPEGVDKDGATGEFTLVFSIQKDNK
nr:hypothetical protein [uncultured Romboutsia sp.]